jgi:hypothetical protein
MKKTALILFIMTLIGAPVLAQETPNEDEMFSDQKTVISIPDTKDKVKEEDTKHIGFSGEITSANFYSMTRDFVKSGKRTDNKFNPYIDGTLLLDARLPANVKGFGSLEAVYNGRTEKSEFSMRELFVDFNIAHAVYMRTGKQVLQWGRCYLWNPTDLVNVEKKSFVTKISAREGAYGFKMHIPFGTAVNMYGFVDTARSSNVDTIAGAYKLEFLLGTTEMAFSIWGKKGYHPVAGYDISTRILDWDILGEASISRGSNTDHIEINSGTISTYRPNKTVAKASIDIGHSFDVGDQKEKFTLRGEFFVNSDGYKKNYFADSGQYFYDRSITIDDGYGNKATLPGGTVAMYLAGAQIYEPNYFSRYYGAIFTSVNKFIISDLTLNINLISNIAQRSYILSSGLAYQDINDLKLGVTVNGYFGRKNTEYTYLKNAADINLTAGILF